jgi:NAD(P)-dependent dehydrogenase (short-subunit alcohol dehydrogenase family)
MGIFDRFRLDGKRLFITGGSRGLGREMAMAIADAGADVIIVGREKESLEKTATDLRAFGGKVWSMQADIGDPEQCEEACKSAVAQFGPINILINNVGGRRLNIPTEEMPLDTWRQMLDLNLTSTFLCTKIIGGEMLRKGKGGRIINTASVNAIVSNRGIAGRHYETAKAAVVQFSRATAADWAPFGITVNAICPGLFMTEANIRWAKESPEIIDTLKNQIPMETTGIPEDMGPLVVYLASDASRYMTGASIVIDGGFSLW